MPAREIAVHNPHGKPLEALPTIYGFNNGGSPGWMYGALLSEDGDGLGSHLCSSEGFMWYDLGILVGSRSDRHEGFRKKYPDGYKMEFVGYDDVLAHAGLQRALEANKAKAKASDNSEAG